MCSVFTGLFFSFFFHFCEVRFVCFDVPMCDLVHDLKTLHDLCLLPTASGNSF